MMKKMNFNNQVSHDDENLIKVLKSSTVKEPSAQLAKETLKKFLASRRKQKFFYKPLKLPLYLMGVIALILSAPFFLTSGFKMPTPHFEHGLKNLIENVYFQLDSWYTFYPLILFTGLLSLVWVELRRIKFQIPFR